MCTHITLKENNNIIAARTMDFSFQLDPEFVFTPRKHKLSFEHYRSDLEDHKAFLGLSKNLGSYKMADGINEDGLSCAALYFEGYASYNKEVIDKSINLRPDEFLHWILAYNSSVEDLLAQLEGINLIEGEIAFIGKTPPLHWVVSDAKGKSIIIEPRDKKLLVYENQVGVLTNSPDYEWHITNLRNYIGIDMNQVHERKIGNLLLEPFGQGSGTFGLPGDYTPPSRFVRASFNRLAATYSKENEDLLSTAIHVLNTVSIPKGSVVTQRKTIDYTQYTSYMDLTNKIYYFKTYDNQNIYAEKMGDYDFTSSDLVVKKLSGTMDYLSL